MRQRGNIAVLLSFLLVFCGCGTKQDAKSEKEYPVLKIALPSVGEEADVETAQEEINAILKEELGVQIELETHVYESYYREMKKNLAKENDYDILFTNHETFTESWMSGYYRNISELLEEYGQGIIDAVGRDILDEMAIDGGLYAVSDVRDYAVTLGTVYLERDILNRFGISEDAIRSEEDLEKYFEMIHKEDPSILIVSTVNYFGNHTPYAFLLPLGVLNEDDSAYVNYFETETYLNHLQKLHRWYEKGWIRAWIKGDTVVLDSEHPFAVYRYGKPGGDIETSGTHDGIYATFLNGSDVLPPGVYYVSAYAISSAAKDPVMAMKILNLFYNDQRINEALARFMYAWTLPNMFLTKVPAGYPDDIWEQQKAFNDRAAELADTAFTFNPTPVMQEYLNVAQIYSRYRPVLETGIADPEPTLQKMNEEMKEAGIDRLIAEKNRQYQIWLNR